MQLLIWKNENLTPLLVWKNENLMQLLVWKNEILNTTFIAMTITVLSFALN
jgi:hypothetical protein